MYYNGTDRLLYWPFWQPPAPYWYPPVVPKQYNYCPKCGLALTEPMGYVCGDVYCPTSPRVTCNENNNRWQS